jgi:hypothetical protein
MILALLGGVAAMMMIFLGGIIGLAYLAFWIWMLVDCLTNNGISGSEKVAWVLVILLLHFLGPLIYLCVGRPKRRTA